MIESVTSAFSSINLLKPENQTIGKITIVAGVVLAGIGTVCLGVYCLRGRAEKRADLKEQTTGAEFTTLNEAKEALGLSSLPENMLRIPEDQTGNFEELVGAQEGNYLAMHFVWDEIEYYGFLWKNAETGKVEREVHFSKNGDAICFYDAELDDLTLEEATQVAKGEVTPSDVERSEEPRVRVGTTFTLETGAESTVWSEAREALGLSSLPENMVRIPEDQVDDFDGLVEPQEGNYLATHFVLDEIDYYGFVWKNAETGKIEREVHFSKDGDEIFFCNSELDDLTLEEATQVAKGEVTPSDVEESVEPRVRVGTTFILEEGLKETEKQFVTETLSSWGLTQLPKTVWELDYGIVKDQDLNQFVIDGVPGYLLIKTQANVKGGGKRTYFGLYAAVDSEDNNLKCCFRKRSNGEILVLNNNWKRVNDSWLKQIVQSINNHLAG